MCDIPSLALWALIARGSPTQTPALQSSGLQFAVLGAEAVRACEKKLCIEQFFAAAVTGQKNGHHIRHVEGDLGRWPDSLGVSRK